MISLLASDISGVNNLQNRSFDLALWKMREILFGLGDPPPEHFPRRLARGLVIYAWATWIYRAILFIGIALLVYAWFFKLLGIILFLVEIAWFIVLPVKREVGIWWERRSEIMASRRGLITTGIAGLVLLGLAVPWRTTVDLPATVSVARQIELHSTAPARISTIEVRSGMQVKKGDLLYRLHAPHLAYEYDRTKLQIELIQARLDRRLAGTQELENSRVLESQLRTYTETLTGIRRKMAQLEIKAAFDGQIREANRTLHVGRWINPNEPLARLTAPQGLELTGYIHERDLGRIEVGSVGTFLPEHGIGGRIKVKARKISAVGPEIIAEKYLASVYDGPIAVNPDRDSSLAPLEGYYVVKLEVVGEAPDIGMTTRGQVRLAGHPQSFLHRFAQQTVKVLRREVGF